MRTTDVPEKASRSNHLAERQDVDGGGADPSIRFYCAAHVPAPESHPAVQLLLVGWALLPCAAAVVSVLQLEGVTVVKKG